jgi:RNA-directed DNA polymerase
MAFTSLAYHMDVEWMREAYRQTRKDGAVGVDDVTAAEYEQDLEGNLQRLLDRAKSGTYRAPPVRRVYIPKGGSTTEKRPIGIPTLEDKILQRAIVMLLEPIYEHDFSESSFGFRPRRSAHQALDALREGAMAGRGGWILEVDIRKFFDTLDHGHLRELVHHRIRDGVVLRLIGKWLKAGVMEDGNVSFADAGSPQGGVISPLLANVYLHYVLDQWFEEEVEPRLHGRTWMVRYADDFVMGFTHESDARRVLEVLPKRFGKFGLTIHPDKTRIVPFQRPHPRSRGKGGGSTDRPGTFDFLGFTHYWCRSRRGYWVVQKKTATDRFRRAVQKVSLWCRRHRHDPVGEQQRKLNQQLQGHYAYYGVTGNFSSLKSYQELVKRIWRYWLNRRNRERSLTWAMMGRLLQRYPLARPRIVRKAGVT